MGAWILCTRPQDRLCPRLRGSRAEHLCSRDPRPESPPQQLAGNSDYPFRRTPTPSPESLGNYSRPSSGLASYTASGIVQRRIPQTRSRAESGPSQRAERKLCPLQGWAGGGLAPRSPALSLCSPRQIGSGLAAAGRAGSRGPAAPGGQRRARLGCKLSGRQEGGGPSAGPQRAPVLGASRRASLVFLFSLVDGGESHKSP